MKFIDLISQDITIPLKDHVNLLNKNNKAPTKLPTQLLKGIFKFNLSKIKGLIEKFDIHLIDTDKIEASKFLKFNDINTMKDIIKHLNVNVEFDIQCMYQYHIVSNMNKLFDGFKFNKDTFQIYRGRGNNNGKIPDFEIRNENEIKMVIEIKNPWCDLIGPFDLDSDSDSDSDSKFDSGPSYLRGEFKQVIDYMNEFNLKYSILSDFINHWIFYKENDSSHEIYISKKLDLNSNDKPTIYQCLFALLYDIHKNPQPQSNLEYISLFYSCN